MNKSPAKKFIAVFALLTACGLLAAALAVVVVDPFFRYHDPLPGFPYIIDNQLSQNIGLAERFPYDAVITGSSMTMNFDTRDFTELLPDTPNPIKLTMNGALPYDVHRMLDAAFGGKSGGDIRTVYIAIDPGAWSAGISDEKYPYPEYLYDRNPFNDVKYWWNREVLLSYCLRPLAERSGTELATLWFTDWEDPMYYTLNWILDHYEEPEEAEEMPEDAYLAATQRNLAENLLPFADAYPGTTFVLFLPPYSVLYWHSAMREGHLAATLSQVQAIGEAVLTRDNVRLFQFQDLEEIVTDLDGGYMDEIHFARPVNRRMVECFADGTCEITTAQELADSLIRLKRIVQDFDFAAILQ